MFYCCFVTKMFISFQYIHLYFLSNHFYCKANITFGPIYGVVTISLAVICCNLDVNGTLRNVGLSRQHWWQFLLRMYDLLGVPIFCTHHKLIQFTYRLLEYNLLPNFLEGFP